MQPDGRATHRRPCRFHEPARTAAGCPGRESGTGEKHSARREQDAPLRRLIACAAPRSTPLGAGNPNPAGSENLPSLPHTTSKAADVIAMKLGISETRDEPGCAPVSATRWPRRRTAATADCRPTSAGCWRPGCSTCPAMRSEPVSSWNWPKAPSSPTPWRTRRARCSDMYRAEREIAGRLVELMAGKFPWQDSDGSRRCRRPGAPVRRGCSRRSSPRRYGQDAA